MNTLAQTKLFQDEAVKRMQAQCFTGDPEADHETADAILVEVLRSFGYHELADTYESVGKWYA